MQSDIPLSRTHQCLNMDQIHLHSAYIFSYCSGWMDLEWEEEENPAHSRSNGPLRSQAESLSQNVPDQFCSLP